MFGRVLVLRGIATTDVATGHAQSQVNPRVAAFQAFFATLRSRFHISDLVGVRTLAHILTSLQSGPIFRVESISSELLHLRQGSTITDLS